MTKLTVSEVSAYARNSSMFRAVAQFNYPYGRDEVIVNIHFCLFDPLAPHVYEDNAPLVAVFTNFRKKVSKKY